MINFQGKIAIVTGSTRGIGRAIAETLAKNDCSVVISSRNNEAVQSTVNELKSLGYQVSGYAADISNIDEAKALVNFAVEKYGKVDILINNAGKLINKPFTELTSNDFLEVYKVNVFGVAEITKNLIPFLPKGSHVVTISSMGGIQGSMKFPGLAAYSSAKGAVITLSELLAEEYKQQEIAFNVLALGAVQTEMLEEAFPDYKAPLSAIEMANYIHDFSLTGNKFYNGKVLEVSSSTP